MFFKIPQKFPQIFRIFLILWAILERFKNIQEHLKSNRKNTKKFQRVLQENKKSCKSFEA